MRCCFRSVSISCVLGVLAAGPQSAAADELALEEVSLERHVNAEMIDFDHPDDGGGHEAYNVKASRPDSHAPAGLMGDHVHEQGEWMFEYKFAQMYMDGNRAGDQRLTDLEALNFDGIGFMVTPTNMSMEMHMFHIMHGLTDDITLYVMPMWMSLTMDHSRRTGFPNNTFRTHNEGFADMPLGFLWRVYNGCTDELIFNVGASVPTGNLQNQVPAGGRFPYPMRLGSGTFDFRPGVSYKSYYERGTFGAQLQTDLPIGTNYLGYREGEQYQLNFWTTRRIGCSGDLALSYRVENLWRNNFSGFDQGIGTPTPTNVSTARTDMRGGYWLNFGYGAIYLLSGGGRLNFEMTHPVYQNLDGVQLETDWMLFGSYSKAF